MNIVEKTFKYYKEKYQRYGKNAQGVGWGSKTSQYKRFLPIVKELEANSSPFKVQSLLDVGCGFGELYKALGKKVYGTWIRSPTKYKGIDISEYHIEECKKDFPKGHFECKDIKKECGWCKYGWVYASGLFAVENKEWKSNCIECLTRMIDLAKTGVMVNFLYGPQINKENHFVTLSELDLLIKELPINEFVLIKNYLAHDITLKIKV